MKSSLIDTLERQFEVSLPRMQAIKKAVTAEMDAGLAGRKSSIAMLPAYCDAASGQEKGLYLALDLGGTNFRVMLVQLSGAGQNPRVVAEAKYRLTREQITGSGDKLFDAIAGYLRKFLKDQSFNTEVALGYTFSFPVSLLAIDEGILMKWTKEFSASGVVGRKIVALQRQALARKGVSKVNIVALANDTVGTLQARAARDPDCGMGVILGTGFNIAVRVATRRIRKDTGAYTGKGMIINTEAGNFAKALSATLYDRRLDRESGNAGHQLVEKMISGKYLPQLVRLLVLELIRKERLFDGRVPAVFADGDSFKGWHMDVFKAGSAKAVQELSRELFGRSLTPAERRIMARVSRLVSRRSARIAAALIAGALTRVERRSSKRVTVAVDGSLFEKHPGYCRVLAQAIRELDGPAGKGVRLVLTKDGSGIGAAVIAAVVSARDCQAGDSSDSL
jgi:hexokinase